jgi:hypothetical protein
MTILILILILSRLVIGTSRTVGSAKKFVRITSGFGGGEFTKTLRRVCTCQTVFDIQYSLLQNNIFKLEIKLYLLSTGTIDHDELFFRNLLSEQVYVLFLFTFLQPHKGGRIILRHIKSLN